MNSIAWAVSAYYSGISRLICLESDNELENSEMDNWNKIETRGSQVDFTGDSRCTSTLSGSRNPPGIFAFELVSLAPYHMKKFVYLFMQLKTTEIHAPSANVSSAEMAADNPFNSTSSPMDSHLVIISCLLHES